MSGPAVALPWFTDEHRQFAAGFSAFLDRCSIDEREDDPDAAVRGWVRVLGEAGYLEPCRRLDVRTLCIARELLAYRSALGDFAFAMQGLGSGAVTMFGSEEQRARWVTPAVRGERIAAFALSEAQAGSDVGAIATRATRDGAGYILSGEKTWISNAGIADSYVVFARTSDDGAKGLSAFVVEGSHPGLRVANRIDTISPHPLGTIAFEDCRLDASARLGDEGDGFRIAMATLDVFRSTVGAAALGFSRRALDETLRHVTERTLFGAPLSDLQMTQAALAEMAVDVDASELLVYRAAWTKDAGAERVTREAAIAKLYATEAAQRVCDRAVQLFGARGVRRGEIVERLYRDVRALRIYEGASEIQKVVIARATLGSAR